jgi:hypothetical protein
MRTLGLPALQFPNSFQLLGVSTLPFVDSI